MNKNFIIYGFGGHGKVLFNILKRNSINNVYFYDDNIEIPSKLYSDLVNCQLIIGIGDNITRFKKANEFINYDFFTLIDPTSIVFDPNFIDFGSVLHPTSFIGLNSKIGKHVIINTASIIEHDVFISDFVHIAPNSTVCGSVKVGIGSFIGAGSIILPNLNVGKWVTIGAGSVVTKDIPDFAVVVGNPGKIIKYNYEQK